MIWNKWTIIHRNTLEDVNGKLQKILFHIRIGYIFLLINEEKHGNYRKNPKTNQRESYSSLYERLS